MAEFAVLEEAPITLAHLKEKLEALEKEEKLSFRGEKTKAYLEGFITLSGKEAQKLHEEVAALNIPRLKERHIVKVLDIMPKDLDSMKVLFSGDNITISDEDLKKILNVIPQ